MKAPESELYKVLFDLSQVIAGHTDLETLCNSLAASLRGVVSFEILSLALYEPAQDQLRLHAMSANRPHDISHTVLPAQGDHPVSRVWRDQVPLVFSPLEEHTGWGDTLERAQKAGIHALVTIPLTNGDRRLGILGFGFDTPYKPDKRSLAFLQRVASEVAVTVDGYLTRKELLHERDRMRVLFDITNALISKLPMEELFAAISEELSRVVAHDFAVVSLLDRVTGEFQLRGLHSRGEFHFEPTETPVTLEGLPTGEAIATGQPVTTAVPDFERFPSPLYRKFANLGFHSGCSIPLVGGNGIAGVLDLARIDTRPFTSGEVDLLVQVGHQIAIAAENALAFRELSQLKDKLATEKLYLEDEIRFDQNIGSMIGESHAFQAVMSSIQVVAPTDATVLIEGETGTGKELVARALHDLSGRSKRSFIKVNCAAIPATLLESELFGHEKGSFTGAFAQKLGRFELAHQGTLFLDEIGEIPLELQSKLLRAIQEQELERLGGNRTIQVNVRLIAATNRSLKRMVEEGTFRSDLYYRLHVFPLTVPPLRERKDDIPLLIRYFTQKFANRMNRPIDSIPSSAIESLVNYDWPGNIRELQNVIERSVILSPGHVLQVTIPDVPLTSPAIARPPRLDESAERERILRALVESRGKVSGEDGAAVKLGLRRTTLQSRMKSLGIERQFK